MLCLLRIVVYLLYGKPNREPEGRSFHTEYPKEPINNEGEWLDYISKLRNHE